MVLKAVRRLKTAVEVTRREKIALEATKVDKFASKRHWDPSERAKSPLKRIGSLVNG